MGWGLPTLPLPCFLQGLRGQRLSREAVSEGPNRDKADCDKWSLVTGPEPNSRTDTNAEPIPTRKLHLREDE